MSADDETKRCPFCAEKIKTAALKCRFCGSHFDYESRSVPVATSPNVNLTRHSTDRPKPSGLDTFTQFTKSIEQLISAGLWLRLAIGLFLMVRGCS